MLLSGCAASTERFVATPIDLPDLPPDLRECAERPAMPLPPKGTVLTEAIIEAIQLNLRKSELGHTACGKRIVAFYDDVVANFRTKR